MTNAKETVEPSVIIQQLLEALYRKPVLNESAVELLEELTRTGFVIEPTVVLKPVLLAPGFFNQYAVWDLSKGTAEAVLDTYDIYSTFGILISYKINVPVYCDQVAFILGELGRHEYTFIKVNPTPLN
jgi:hypothetical protein